MGKYLHTSRRFVLLLAGGIILGSLVLAMFFPTTRTRAEDREYPRVIDSDSVVFGRTFGEWSAAWEQWAYSIKVDQHPLFDNGDCTVAQSGPVWFLGGKFCANGATCSATGVVRSCNVPRGKALYFPVINGEDSALEEVVAQEHSTDPDPEFYQQIAGMRVFEDTNMTGMPVYCSVDGAWIPDLQRRFRVQSVAFGFTIPDNNYLKAVYPSSMSGGFKAGTYYPAIDDGYYVMLAPLAPGHHTLHFGGGNPTWLDITYHLHVQ